MGDSTSSNNSPRPLQIIDFQPHPDPTVQHKILTIHEDNLHHIFEGAGSRPVVILAIAGPSRKGKSFFLDFVIRYFSALEKDESDWMGWEEKDKPLEGFSWKTSNERETTGIVGWSRPFLVKSNGKEVAVILMDTQGTYDEYTTEREMTAIVGLSLLSSSILIFNFFNEILEDVFNSLDTYITYGQLALGGGDAENDDNGMEVEVTSAMKPFQKLLFLIRDWGRPQLNAFGSKGGEGYLKDKLKIKEGLTPSGKKVRMTLEQCFTELECYLLPNPGGKSMEDGFNGSLSHLSSLFCKQLEKLINELLDPDTMPVKSIFGSEVMAADMVNYIKTYVEVFNSDEIPAPVTLMEATAKISNDNLVNTCLRNYKDAMKKKLRGKMFLADGVLLKGHKQAWDKALDEFGKTKKLGNKELFSDYEGELAFRMKEEFEKIDRDNKAKKLKLVNEAAVEALKSFKEAVNDEFADDDEFLENRKLSGFMDSHKATAVSEFKDKLSELDDKELEKAETELDTKLGDEAKRFEQDNTNRRLQAEKKMGDIIYSIKILYEKDLKGKLEEEAYMDEETLRQYHEESKPEYHKRFASSKKPCKDNKFLKPYTDQFESELEKVFDSILKEHKLKLQEEEDKVESLLQNKLLELEETLKEKIEEEKGNIDDDDFEPGKRILQNFETSIENELQFIPEETKIGTQLRKKFRASLNSKFAEVMKDALQGQKDCTASYEKAVEEGLSVYVGDFMAFLGSGFKEEGEFQTKHDELLDTAIKAYEGMPKAGVHPKEEEFQEALESKILQRFRDFEQRNEERKSQLLTEMENCVLTQHNEYQSKMITNLEQAKDEDEFEELHKKELKNALDNLASAYQGKTPPSFLAQSEKELEEKIQTTFDDELKEVFELELKDRTSGTTNAIGDARKLYREEMAKHYNNAEFMRPKDLEELHEKMSRLAIDDCKKKTPLTQIQVDDLKAALLETYQDYKEDNDKNVPTDDTAIGIDLGTTYSCVAVYVKGQVKVIPNAQGKNTTPSFVSYKDIGTVECVGIPAKDKAYENAENTVFDAKRIIGRQFNDPVLQNDMTHWPFEVVSDKDVPKVRIGGKFLFPEQVSSEILKEMKSVAEAYLHCTVEKAVITVPAYFNDGQRQATIDAGQLAGLKVLNILSEPVSAAVAYKLQHSDNYGTRHVLTFDLGGGTFDVAVLKRSKGKIEALAVDGDTHLGGEDFDQNMMKHCALEFKRANGIDLFQGKDSRDDTTRQECRRRLKRLQLSCEKKKMELSSCRSVDITIDGFYNDLGSILDLKANMTRDKFEELNEELFKKTITIVERCLTTAQINKSSIDDIVLVGGSTRIPKVQELLTEFFEGRALNRTINPDEAVAYGAAIQAAMMNGQIAQESKDYNTIQDVTPMSLGVEVYGGGFSVIIPKNTKVPVKFKEQYRTAHNNQTSVQITVYQGEDPVAQKNSWLGEFYLNNVPPGDAGKEKIDVTMEINLQGVLHVTAVCTSTGEKDSITVTEHKRRMNKQDIKNILAEARPGGA